MKLHDKEAILAELQRGQAALLHALKDVPEDGAGRAPGPGKWSILECVEHLAVAEEYLLSQMISARQCDAPVVDERREALITLEAAPELQALLARERAQDVAPFLDDPRRDPVRKRGGIGPLAGRERKHMQVHERYA